MADKKPSLYIGTPLNKFLDDDVSTSNNRDGPITSRQIRLNRQQYVRDEQGRRRFHGAFTGGFSAGYYNSVDTAQGFRPKNFVSHRRDKRDGGSANASNLGQKPEDFMDDEDLGEFGIAPRKIRLVSDYQSESRSTGIKANEDGESRLQRLINPRTVSIGEEIFRRMTGRRPPKDDCSTKDISSAKKNDLHGLGYKPLSIPFSNTGTKHNNPLEAILGGGKLLKISGEAFGSGVLDDDEDNVENADEYGYDDIASYESSARSKIASHRANRSSQMKRHEPPPLSDPANSYGILRIAGFTQSKTPDSRQCDDILKKYPLPDIPPGWRMPTRSEPYIPPAPSRDTDEQELSWQKTQQATDSFTSKFTPSTSNLVSVDKIEQKSGLLSYSDLKAVEDFKSRTKQAGVVNPSASKPEKSITRSVFEWRPCSLLCKHFNVPNPFPDNSFFGLKPNSSSECADESSNRSRRTVNKEHDFHEEAASIEYLRSIFNVVVELGGDDYHDDDCDNNDSSRDKSEADDSEDEPQILETDGGGLVRECERSRDSDNDSDVVVMSMPKPEPEVIVLSSSSLSTSSSCSSMSTGDRNKKSSGGQSRSGMDQMSNDSDLDDDSYGPPLPPTRQTLLGADRHSSVSRHRSSSSLLKSDKTSSKRKRKREKRKKRKKSTRSHGGSGS